MREPPARIVEKNVLAQTQSSQGGNDVTAPAEKDFYQKIGDPTISPPPLSALAQEPGLQIQSIDGSITITASDNPGDSTVLNLAGVTVGGSNPTNISNAVTNPGLLAGAARSDHAHALLLDTKPKIANYPMTTSDCVIRATGGAGGITITLPAASASTIGMVAIIMKIDSGAGAVSVVPAGVNTILGGNPSLAAQGNSIMLRGASASSWEKIASL